MTLDKPLVLYLASFHTSRDGLFHIVAFYAKDDADARDSLRDVYGPLRKATIARVREPWRLARFEIGYYVDLV